MHIVDTYRTLGDSELICAGDEWTMSSLFDSKDRLWAPCESFVGHRVREIAQTGRLLLRRKETSEIRPT